MKINKVLKKLKNEGKVKISSNTSDDMNNIYPTSASQTTDGFHAKANSQKGAERQRSMGNRLGVRTNKSTG